MTTPQSGTGFSLPGYSPGLPQSTDDSAPSTADYRSRSDRGSPKKVPRGDGSGCEEESEVRAPSRTMAAGATVSRSANMVGRKPWADIEEDEEQFEQGVWTVTDDEVASRGRCSQTSRTSSFNMLKKESLRKLKEDAAKENASGTDKA